MNKKLLVIPVIVLVLTMLLAVTGFACGDCGCAPCPPPPCDDECATDCSPGYWKNHTDWMSDPQWAHPDWMLAALKAKGNEPMFDYRFMVAGWLNDVGYEWADCD